MADTTYINGSAALRSFMQGIHSRVNELLDERGINASGRLQRSNRVDLRESVSASTGTLSALSYWRTAGSGSPPGTAVEWTALQRWAMDKGLANNERRAARIAMLVQRKILREGSKQWREHGENVYMQAIEEAQGRIPSVLRAFLRDEDSRHRKEFIQTFRAA